ncbi:unnamed protein product [Calypogeia fissa]
MALSMHYASRQLLVENRLPRSKTGTSQPSKANHNLTRRNATPMRKVPLWRAGIDRTVSTSHNNEGNSTSNTEESRFLPSEGGQGRKTVSLDSGIKLISVGQSTTETATGDAVNIAVKNQNWLQSVLPDGLWPYAQLARIDKPVGSWVLAWPSFWSLCLATPGGVPDLKIVSLLGLWAIAMRGAACTVNDMLDRDIDAQVERTRSRPFPAGTVNLFQGMSFLGLQFLLGIWILTPLSPTSQLIGAAFAPLACIYPLMKRVTYWPQAFLGVFFSFGIPLGWAAVNDNFGLSTILPLFGSNILFSIVVDTIYAHQDKEFDREIGVKSTALLFGDKTTPILGVLGAICIGLLALTGYNCGLGWPLYAGVAAAAGHLGWQIFTVDLDDPEDCGTKFRSNQWYGAIVCGAILLGNMAASHP